jgi:hypothetical protein
MATRTDKGFIYGWARLSRPKRNGGWDIHDLNLFNQSLNFVTLWRVLNVESLWHDVIRDKYLHNASLIVWLRKTNLRVSPISRIWASLLCTIPIILNWISWIPRSGTYIKIGCDVIIGLGSRSFLSKDLRSLLSNIRITHLAHTTLAHN